MVDCSQVSKSITLASFSCKDDIMGDYGNLVNFGRSLGSIPGQLGNVILCAGESLAAKLEKSITNMLGLFDKIFGKLLISIPSPVFVNLKIPEYEMEIRLRALWQDFKIYLYQTIFNFLSKIPPLNFILDLLNVPIPFLPGIKLMDLLTAKGIQAAVKVITQKFDKVMKLLGAPWNLTFTGELIIKNVEMAIQNVIYRARMEVENMLSNILFRAWNALINIPVIKQIWRLFQFPLLPTFENFDFKAVFDKLWDKFKRMGWSLEQRMQKMIDYWMNYDFKSWLNKVYGVVLNLIPWPFPTIIKKVLNLVNKEWQLTSPELLFHRIIVGAENLMMRLPGMVMELWQQLVTAFLKKAASVFPIINEILKFIPFTFCSFINLVASPVLTLGAQTAALLPPQIKIQPFKLSTTTPFL